MISKKRFWIVVGCLVLLLAGTLIFISWASREFSLDIQAVWRVVDGRREKLDLPYSRLTVTKGLAHEFSVDVNWRKGAPTRLRIIPDDFLESITVNGKALAQARYAGPGQADWLKGQVVDFSGFLSEGRNVIGIRIIDRGGGGYGLNLVEQPYTKSPLRTAAVAFAIGLVLCIVWFVLRRRMNDWMIIAILLAGLTVHLVSVSVRSHKQYAYDLYEGGTGHVNYIQYIVDKGALPRPDRSWSYYHPPLYYLSAAGIYSLAQAAEVEDPFKPLQLLSLAYYWIFIAFSYLLIKEFVKSRWPLRLAVALLVFWPAGSINAIRLGNDSLLTALYAAGLYYGHRWFVSGRRRDLYFAAAACGLGFLAKISIAPLAAILGVLIIWRWMRKRRSGLRFGTALAALAIMAAGFFAGAVDNWYYALQQKRKDWYMAPFSNIDAVADKALFSNNRLVNYVVPDLTSWFESTFISSRDDTTGRANYWNYLFKTSLYGEFSFSEGYRKTFLAPLINVALFVLVAISLVGLLRLLRRRRAEASSGQPVLQWRWPARRHLRVLARDAGRYRAAMLPADFRFVTVSTCFLLALLLLTRIESAMPCLNDFRYVVPFLPVLIVAIVSGVDRFKIGGLSRKMLFFAGWVFALASAIFYFGI